MNFPLTEYFLVRGRREVTAHSDKPLRNQNIATQATMPVAINVQQMRFHSRQLVSGLKNFDPAPYCRNTCSTIETRRFRLSSGITTSTVTAKSRPRWHYPKLVRAPQRARLTQSTNADSEPGAQRRVKPQ